MTDLGMLENEIIENYLEGDTELNAMFFDMDVKAAKKDLLDSYAYLVHEINGDNIVVLNDKEKAAYGEDASGTPFAKEMLDPSYDEIFEGKYVDFLRSFVSREKETGLARIYTECKKGPTATGALLEFVL